MFELRSRVTSRKEGCRISLVASSSSLRTEPCETVKFLVFDKMLDTDERRLIIDIDRVREFDSSLANE